MDLATVIGILGGVFMTIFGIVSGDLGFAALGNFGDFPSIIITIGGSMTSIITMNKLEDVVNGLKSIKLAFSSPEFNVNATIRKIIDLSNVARKEGLLALEEAAEEINDSFMKKGILLIVDGTDPELIKAIMETELDCLENRHGKVMTFWEQIKAMGPAWGMIGTLIGLVNMLKVLDDPSKIGPNMAVALLTTLYGSLMANWLADPIGTKLSVNNDKEIMLKAVIIEGLLSIQAGENPRVIEEKLKSFLAPSERENWNEAGEGGE